MDAARSPILVVEDEPLVLDTTADLLADGGHRVVKARSSGEAIAILEGSEAPAVVVTDIALGAGDSGVDLARTIAERWPHIRVIIVSGSQRPARDTYPESALFFTKPYAPGALLAMVDESAF